VSGVHTVPLSDVLNIPLPDVPAYISLLMLIKALTPPPGGSPALLVDQLTPELVETRKPLYLLPAASEVPVFIIELTSEFSISPFANDQFKPKLVDFITPALPNGLKLIAANTVVPENAKEDIYEPELI
jgi:hypothetical protein